MICGECLYDDTLPIGTKWGVPVLEGFLMLPEHAPNGWSGIKDMTDNGRRLVQHFAHRAGAIKVLQQTGQAIVYAPCGIAQAEAEKN